MKRYQITERFDWFNQSEIMEIIKNLKDEEKVEIIRLDDLFVENYEGGKK